VADMFCLLRIELELAVQAKARLIAQQAGLNLPVDPDVHAALDERRYLEQSIGRTGLLALEPLRITSHRDYWHQHLLSQRG
jgi:protease PrsW